MTIAVAKDIAAVVVTFDTVTVPIVEVVALLVVKIDLVVVAASYYITELSRESL